MCPQGTEVRWSWLSLCPSKAGQSAPFFSQWPPGSLLASALMEDNQMQRDSATPASQCRHSVTLSPGVPNTFLTASEEARLVESKAYFTSSSSISVLEEIAFKKLIAKVVLSFWPLQGRAGLGGSECFVSSTERES